MSNEQEGMLAAYHQAAKAVIARYAGLTLRSVAINKANIPIDKNRSWQHVYIAVSYAGLMAERKLCELRGWPVDNTTVFSSLEDFQQRKALALEMAEIMPPASTNSDTAGLYKQLGYEAAREWIDRPRIWRAIEKLAALLLERQTLTGKEARAAIDAVVKVAGV